jgi:undecaprenyl-diphosphatase
MPPADAAPGLAHALVLGLLQGPAELLPISSSAHTTLIPWLAGWPYAQLDGQQRKSFEVALHAGAGAALAIHMRRDLLRELARLDRRRAGVIALSLAPAALTGYALGGPIERRLGSPRSIAAGLLAGALAMALAEHRAGGRSDAGRSREDATARDGLALGLAQAAALIPGVSRNGATLSAARWGGFSRRAAHGLSWSAGLPVILGASLLKAARLRRTGLAREQRTALMVGAGAAFLSTRASALLLEPHVREGRRLWPFTLYRCALAVLVLSRVRAQHHHERRGVRAQ